MLRRDLPRQDFAECWYCPYCQIQLDEVPRRVLGVQFDPLEVPPTKFILSATAWQQFPTRLLPDEIAPFGETRRLMWRKHQLFLQQGMVALGEIAEINGRLTTLREEISTHFPLTQPEIETHREHIAAQVEAILACEREAILVLQAAIK